MYVGNDNGGFRVIAANLNLWFGVAVGLEVRVRVGVDFVCRNRISRRSGVWLRLRNRVKSKVRVRVRLRLKCESRSTVTISVRAIVGVRVTVRSTVIVRVRITTDRHTHTQSCRINSSGFSNRAISEVAPGDFIRLVYFLTS